MKTKQQMSETLFLVALLAVVGGFLDAYTYLTRGEVFANAQTGNMVLLAIDLARGNFTLAFRYLIPIFAFATGVLVAEAVRARFHTHPTFHWRQIVVAAEILILLAAAFTPRGPRDNLINVSISFVCALQVESFRKIQGKAMATTMCTGNLRSGTELLFHFFQSGDKARFRPAFRYYSIILFFIAGASLGVWFTSLLEERAVLLCCGLLLIAFFAMFIRNDLEQECM